MAVGDLVVSDYQYEFSGLLMGRGTPYLVESWDGLYGIPDLNLSDVDRTDRHGSIAGEDVMKGRTITGKLNLLEEGGAIALESRIVDFQNAMRIRNMMTRFVYQRPGTGKRYIDVRPRKSALPTDYDLAHGIGKLAVEFFAPDVRHYALTPRTANITLAALFATATLVINSAGKYYTEPVFTIPGPATNIRLTVTGQTAMDDIVFNNRTIALDVALGISDTLVIDVKNRNITLNGVPRYDLKRGDNQWWSILPGSQSITYARSGSNTGSASSMTIAWNDAWVL